MSPAASPTAPPNPAQLEAVHHLTAPCLVLAGTGPMQAMRDPVERMQVDRCELIDTLPTSSTGKRHWLELRGRFAT